METIKKIRLVLDKTKEEGYKTISIEAFETYLASIENQHHDNSKFAERELQRDLALFSAENDRNIANAINKTASALEMFKSVISSAQAALKACMVINGGAAVALLAFVGNLLGKNSKLDVASGLSFPIFLFCIGIVLGAIASGSTYITQSLHSYQKVSLAQKFTIFTMLLVMGSYAIFIIGAFITANYFNMVVGL